MRQIIVRWQEALMSVVVVNQNLLAGLDALPDTGTGGAVLYVTSAGRDYAVALAPLGGVREQTIVRLHSNG